MESDLSPARSCGVDGQLFQFRIHRLDILQLVFSLYGAGTWFRPKGERTLLYASVLFDDGFLSCGGVLNDRLTRNYGLRTGRCALASAALFLTAGFLVLGSQVHSPSLAGLILAGGAGTLYLSQSAFFSVSVDIAGRSSGVFSSIVNMGGQIGGAVTASLTPWIAHRFGWTSSFGTAAVLAVVGGLCWMVVHPERPLD